MNIRLKLLPLAAIVLSGLTVNAQKIDRKALVSRHNVILTSADTLGSLSVGNGRFAFTVDATGLQTFPEYYQHGVPLGTQSEWGWHSFKDTVGYKFEETLKSYNMFGHGPATYSVQIKEPKRNKQACDWFRENVHRLQLGNLGFRFIKKDGSDANVSDIKNIRQQLDLWNGEIHSSFTVEGTPVEVWTDAHQQMDEIGVRVKSSLLNEGRLKIDLKFPFPSNEFSDFGTNYKNNGKHQSGLVKAEPTHAVIYHQLDDMKYYTAFNWTGTASAKSVAAHRFEISPDKGNGTFEFTCLFTPHTPPGARPTFVAMQANNRMAWPKFWKSGGAVDFKGSTDKRANELERRIILSQYLMKVQEAGDLPPQETGLTYNSWYGKPHMEMHYWHSLHWALWNRPELLEPSMQWYFRASSKAKEIAKRQGYDGVRWQKMTDPDGNESPSSVGAFLIWQQPHFITFVESIYRVHHDPKVLQKYKDLVFATADFMASFPTYDKEHDRYLLAGIILAQERYKPEETFNPPYELQYWYWALKTAQEWRKRLGLAPNKKYDEVMEKLSALPQKDGVYLPAESAQDGYTNPKLKTDHPSVLATYGMLPGNSRLDVNVMKRTFNLIWKTWDWQDTWGWDFPMTAMSATRLGLPDKAIDALFMPIHTNTYLPDGHNYQDGRLTLYMPGNGGLLSAVALMCAGWDGCKTTNPGFPKNGKWKVKWEGLQRLP